MNNCCVIVPAAVQPTSDTSDRMARFSAHVVVILFLNSLKWEISLLAWRRLRSLSQTFCDVVIHVTGKILQGIWTETRRQHKPMIFLDVGLTARRWIAAQLISTHTHTHKQCHPLRSNCLSYPRVVMVLAILNIQRVLWNRTNQWVAFALFPQLSCCNEQLPSATLVWFFSHLFTFLRFRR